jgi:acyl-CoA synthetase (AMP-forming)/AMP-acid ligase II
MSDLHRSFTYAEVDRRAAAFAEQLTSLGIGAGDAIAIMLPNRLELLIGMLGAWRVGAMVTPVNPTFTDRELEYQLEDSQAKLLLSDAVRETAAPTILTDEMWLTPTGPSEKPRIPESRIALLIYTSGSTGRPKGVMLDHANLHAMAGQTAEAFDLGADDHALMILPLFHVNSITSSFLAPITVGAQLTVVERFSPESFIRAVETTRPTYFSAVPAIYGRLAALPDHVRFDTSSLRFAICGAAPVDKGLLSWIETRFRLILLEGYGLTEGTCASTVNPLRGERRPGTVGLPLPGQRVAIMDEDGVLQPPGEIGEVVISGPTVMRGYLGRPEETAQAIRDGWLHTGDVGVLDGDGYLRIVGRIKDMIIRGGENLYPAEIEEHLIGHPDVLEAAVVGSPHPVLGEIPVAFVVARADETINSEELAAHCRTGLAKIKVPESITVVPRLPRNAMGKIDKPLLRQQAASAVQQASTA